MAVKKSSSLDRVLGRLDTLDAVNLANLVQRLARERGVFEEIFNTLQEGILVVRDDGARLSVFHLACERLVSVETLNSPADHMIARQLLEAGVTPPDRVMLEGASALKAWLAQG